jgi:uncharacterized protein YjbJ (UPF0337 family)
MKGEDMNRDILGGYWKQLRGRAKEAWGDLTDDEWTEIAGRRDQLAGKLQERYGWNRERADEEIERFITSSEAELRNTDSDLRR